MKPLGHTHRPSVQLPRPLQKSCSEQSPAPETTRHVVGGSVGGGGTVGGADGGEGGAGGGTGVGEGGGRNGGGGEGGWAGGGGGLVTHGAHGGYLRPISILASTRVLSLSVETS